MTRILAIEAATEACSAALLIDGELRERFELAPRRHVALLLPFVDALLAEASIRPGALDAVAFGCGPGSFTGLRIAAGITQGIAFGSDLPVIPVSTLAALAQGTVRQQGAVNVLAALDARMQEVYWGVFHRDSEGRVTAAGEEQVCAPEAVVCPQPGEWSGAGSGWLVYADRLLQHCAVPAAAIYAQQQPHAADVALLAVPAFAQGKVLAAEQVSPVYLRNNVARKPQTAGSR